MLDPLPILQSTFGFPEFRGVQRQVVDRVLAGENTLAVMPTGAGKSLCYQLPAVALPGTCVIVSPLIALMHDQLRAAEAIGIRAATSGGRHDRYAPGLHHLAWRVESRDAVDAAHALLVEHRIPVLDSPAHYPEYSGDYYAVFFADPDGLKLEIVHAPGWI